MSNKNSDSQKLIKQLKAISSPDTVRDNHKKYILNGNYTQSISEIHEYCIKNIITEQAEGFYKAFYISELSTTLIDYFIKMEQFKRENRYEEFCLSIYQQIETIVNYIFKQNNIEKYIESNLNKIVLTKYDVSSEGYVTNGKYNLKYLIFYNSHEWNAKTKFKSILYINYFRENIGYNTNEFYERSKILSEIYNMRNLVHSGTILYPSQQEIIERSIKNKFKNYLKYQGFLEDFITKIHNNNNII